MTPEINTAMARRSSWKKTMRSHRNNKHWCGRICLSLLFSPPVGSASCQRPSSRSDPVWLILHHRSASPMRPPAHLEYDSKRRPNFCGWLLPAGLSVGLESNVFVWCLGGFPNWEKLFWPPWTLIKTLEELPKNQIQTLQTASSLGAEVCSTGAQLRFLLAALEGEKDGEEPTEGTSPRSWFSRSASLPGGFSVSGGGKWVARGGAAPETTVIWH